MSENLINPRWSIGVQIPIKCFACGQEGHVKTNCLNEANPILAKQAK